MRLKITPEGVGDELEVDLDRAHSAGLNEVVVLNDHYEFSDDTEYTNTE